MRRASRRFDRGLVRHLVAHVLAVVLPVELFIYIYIYHSNHSKLTGTHVSVDMSQKHGCVAACYHVFFADGFQCQETTFTPQKGDWMEFEQKQTLSRLSPWP